MCHLRINLEKRLGPFEIWMNRHFQSNLKFYEISFPNFQDIFTKKVGICHAIVNDHKVKYNIEDSTLPRFAFPNQLDYNNELF